jgi:hypothetical protein
MMPILKLIGGSRDGSTMEVPANTNFVRIPKRKGSFKDGPAPVKPVDIEEEIYIPKSVDGVMCLVLDK